MKVKVFKAKELENVKLGTHLQFHDNKLWIIDQNSSDILNTNKNWRNPEQANLFHQPKVPTQGKFYLPSIKPGLATNTIVEVNSIPRLLVLGNGGNEPYSKYGILFNLDSLHKEDLDLTLLFQQIEKAGIKNPNIIAAATFPDDQIILAHQPTNEVEVPKLIIVKNKFWKKPSSIPITILPIEFPNKPTAPFHLTDFAYAPENDWLLFTAHTSKEHSINYLGIIENASRKVGRKHMKVNELIVLNKHIEDFEQCNVESVCVQSEKVDRIKIQLLSHHQNGFTTLYKLKLKEDGVAQN